MNPNSDNSSNDGCKTREELALAYGITPRALYNWLREAGIVPRRRRLTPKSLAEIFDLYGKPGPGDKDRQQR